MNQRNDKGLREGYWEDKHGDMVIYKGSYVNGQKHGLWLSASPTSNRLNWAGYFDMDTNVGFWCWYLKGELKTTLEFFL